MLLKVGQSGQTMKAGTLANSLVLDASGAAITGDITVTGTVDGVDIIVLSGTAAKHCRHATRPG